MQLFVKSLAGNTLAFEVAPSASIENVKAMIAAREGMTEKKQRKKNSNVLMTRHDSRH